MDNIIKSLLDNDLYKFTQQQAVLELFPNTNVEYRFKNRGKQRFTKEFLVELENQINRISELKLTAYEYLWLKENIPFFKPSYLEYLKNYRFNSKEVACHLNEDKDLVIKISGKWRDAILWEVPLMAIISELYFKIIDTNWEYNSLEVQVGASNKITKLNENHCSFAEFGTRRRRSFKTQDEVIGVFKRFEKYLDKSYFAGSSNVYFAMKYGVKAIGTMAHELYMGVSVLSSLRHANYYTLQKWADVFGADLGIALTDTYGTDAFFNDFNMRLSKLYDGLRHDSGDPFKLTDKAVAHYKKMRIDPLSKVIVFSDGLNIDKAIKIKEYCEGLIKCSFGIGTHITNDFKDSPALNMVIKLYSCEGIPVVKLSDSPSSKATGDADAIKVAKWTFNGQSLDS